MITFRQTILRTGLPALLLSAWITTSVQAQKEEKDVITFYSAPTLDSLLQASVSTQRIAGLLGKSDDGSPYLVIIRTKPGDAEVHEQYDDVAIIRSGRGVLRTGSGITGQKESGQAPAREWVGGKILNTTERTLHPGDFIVIPAMIPHQYIPLEGDTLTYWTIKVKAAKVAIDK